LSPPRSIDTHRPSFPTRRSSDLVNVLAAAEALGDIVSSEFDVHPSRERADLPVRFEEAEQLIHDVVEPPCLVSRCGRDAVAVHRSEEHTSELQSRENLVCRLLLE